MSVVSVALKHARDGDPVFTIGRGTKNRPRSDWANCGATVDPANVFDDFFGQAVNLGVRTDRLIVVDVDGHRGGFTTLASHPELPPTFTVRTPNGGVHLYFRAPAGAAFSGSTNRLGQGIDIKAGPRSYVLGAGSSFAGRDYVLERDAPIAVAPTWLCEHLAAARERSADAPKVLGDVDTAAAIESARAYLESSAPLAVEGSGGNETSYRVACAVKDRGVSPETALQLMLDNWNERCSPAWESDDLETIIRNAYTYGQVPIGRDNPEAGFVPIDLPKPERSPPLSFWLDDPADDAGVRWLIDEAIPRGSIGFEGGKSGSGKTFLAVHTAVCGALGRPFFGRAVPERFGTYFVAAEGGYSIKQRVRAAAGHGFGLSATEARALPFKFTKGAPDLMSASGLAAFIEDLMQTDAAMRARYGVPIGLIVFDTFGQTFALREENSPTEVTKATKIMHRCAAAVRAAAVATHHFGHGPERLRGSSAFRANADFVIEVRERGEVFLEKCRDAPEVRLGWMGLPIVEVGRKGDGAPITSRYVKEITGPALAAALTKSSKPNGAEIESWTDMMSAFDRVKTAGESGEADKADTTALRNAFIAIRGGSKEAAGRNFRRQKKKLLAMGFLMEGRWLLKPKADMADMSVF